MAPSESTQPMSWLREDLRELREALGDNTRQLGELSGKVEGYQKSLDEHARDCPARNKKHSSTTLMPPPRSTVEILRRWAPVFVAIAFGLLGLGAYFGQSSDVDQRIQKIQAAVDSALKVQK